MKDIRDYSLLAHNTFGIDAKCKRFLEYSSVEEAQLIVAGLTAADQPLLILGGGSNLLLTGDYQARCSILPSRALRCLRMATWLLLSMMMPC